jgi:hypothetical protein
MHWPFGAIPGLPGIGGGGGGGICGTGSQICADSYHEPPFPL